MPHIERDEENEKEVEANKNNENKLFLDSISINQANPIVRDMDCEQKEKLENEFRMDRGHIMV